MAPMTWLGKTAGSAVVLAIAIGACGRPMPSSAPLGGEEEPRRKEPAVSTSEGPGLRETPVEEAAETALVEEPESSTDPEDDLPNGAKSDGQDEEAEDEEELASVLPAAASLPACDDSTPATFDCGPLSQSCPVFAPLCAMLDGMLKPKVGQALATCIVEGGCDFEGMEGCARKAIQLACVDDSARAFCADRAEACADELRESEATREDCEYAVSSLLPNVRQRFTSCLENSCDLELCLMRVLPMPR